MNKHSLLKTMFVHNRQVHDIHGDFILIVFSLILTIVPLHKSNLITEAIYWPVEQIKQDYIKKTS